MKNLSNKLNLEVLTKVELQSLKGGSEKEDVVITEDLDLG